MKTINGKVDNDILALALQLGNPVVAIPAPVEQDSLNQINPHVTRFLYEDGLFRDIFSVKQVYYLHKVTKEWRPMTEVASYNGNRKIILNEKWTDIHPSYLKWLQWRTAELGGQVLVPSPVGAWGSAKTFVNFLNMPDRVRMGLSTLTKYPDTGNPGSATTDGDILSRAIATWAGCRDATDGTGLDHASTAYLEGEYGLAAGNYYLHRSIMNFDTSALTSGASISAASVFATGLAGNISDTDGNAFSIVLNTITSATTYATADFDLFGTTKQSADVNWNGYSTSNFGNEHVFNGTGLGNISKTGISKFGLVSSRDISNTAPASNNYCIIYAADSADSAKDEKLVVTYTNVSGPANLKSLNTSAIANIKSWNTVAIANLKKWNTIT